MPWVPGPCPESHSVNLLSCCSSGDSSQLCSCGRASRVQGVLTYPLFFIGLVLTISHPRAQMLFSKALWVLMTISVPSLFALGG